MRDFARLRVWQLATARLPSTEKYGLQSQMRRAATSIAANIAEGCGRETPAELRRFVSLAAGSASELESHLIVCSDLGFLTPKECDALRLRVRGIRRMLRRYSESTKAWD